MAFPWDREFFEHNPFSLVRTAWLDQHKEDVLDPELAIVDAHHHLWDHPGTRYLLEEYLSDTGSGHKIIASVFIEGCAMYKADGPDEWKSLGETEFATGVAAMSESGNYGATRVCAGIVGNVDLTGGTRVREQLERHMAVAGPRFRGVRNVSGWEGDKRIKCSPTVIPRGLLAFDEFLRGFAELKPLNLSFDAYLFHTQLEELEALAGAFPDTTIILNHVATPLGIGDYAGRTQAVFDQWSRGITALARHSRVHVKIGGLGMYMTGFGFDRRDKPPSSADVAATFRPYVDHCIQAFGPERCMFESNFPVDKAAYSYRVLWNAFKRLTAGYSVAERKRLFADTAREVYGLRLEES